MTGEQPEVFLVCPQCHKSDELKSVERVLGHLGMTLQVVRSPDDEHEAEVAFDYHDSTEIFWDTSETIGVHCNNCDYDDVEPEWLARLIAGQPTTNEDD